MSAEGLVYAVSTDVFAHTNPSAVVTLEATLADGSPLPRWVQFDSRAAVFKGTPPDKAAADIDIKITATDDAGREAYVVFRPILGASGSVLASATPDALTEGDTIAGRTAQLQRSQAFGSLADQSGSGFLRVARNAGLIDAGNTSLNSAIMSIDGSAASAAGGRLPAEQGFPAARVDAASIVLAAEGNFTGGQALFVYRGFADQSFPVNLPLNFQVPTDAFAHTDPSAIVLLEARLVDGSPLPAWLSFNSVSGVFTGNPPSSFGETLDIEIVAWDEEGRVARISFTLELGAIVVETDAVPQWEQADLTARDGADAEAIAAAEAAAKAALSEAGAPSRDKADAKTAVHGDKTAIRGAVRFTEQARATRTARDPVLERIVVAKGDEKAKTTPERKN